MQSRKLTIIIFISILILGLVVLAFIIGGNKAQPTKIYKIGLLQMASTVDANIDGFKLGMRDFGYKEGENVNYIYYNAEGNADLVKSYAKKLVDEKVDLIFANTSPATEAAKQATENTDIPVVFSMVADPERAGFIASVQSSGNNLTGTSCAYIDIAGKRLEKLKEAFPGIQKVMVFYREGDKSGEPATEEIKKAGRKIGVQIIDKRIKNSDEIKAILKDLKAGEVDAIMDPADSTVTANIDALVEASARLRIPLMMLSYREADKGAILTYGVDYFDLGEQSAALAGKILSGSKPSEIPIEMPRRFNIVANLKTANQIGLVFPEKFLAQVDQIIK